MSRCLCLCLLHWPLLMVLSGLAMAQVVLSDQPDTAFDQLVDAWRRRLDHAEQQLQSPSLQRNQIKTLLDDVRNIRQEALDAGETAAAGVTTAQRMLAALGSTPTAAEPAENQRVSRQRQQLEQQLAEYGNRFKSCRLILVEVDILIERIAAAEEAIILRVIRERVPPPFMSVSAGLSQLREIIDSRREAMVREWTASAPHRQRQLMSLGALLATSLVGVLALHRWLLRHHGRDPTVKTPARGQRLRACMVELLGNGVVPALLLGALFVAVQTRLPWSDSIRLMLNGLLLSSLQWILLIAVARAALAPDHPPWRLHGLDSGAATGLYRGIWWLLLVAILMKILGGILDPALNEHGWLLSEDTTLAFFSQGQQAAILVGGSGLILVALLTLQILRPRHWFFSGPEDGAGTTARAQPALPGRLLLWLARLSMMGCVLLGLTGHVAAGLLIYVRICWTLVALGAIWFLHRLIGEGLLHLFAAESRPGAWLRQRPRLQDPTIAQLVFWLQLLISTAALMILAVSLLLVWGVPRAYLARFSERFIDGFTIGGIVLSPVTIAAALAVFLMLLAGTRLLQSFLSQRILVQTGLDIGLRDALSTISGYLGVLVAVLGALAVLGVDFGKITLVLGGLSIGIGLGLQHIVNNFVSGLILLFQRPIKAGDWVVMGDYQGYVKRINVITTEIETFDNASVLIPNSKLASTEVLNWTHRSTLGRVIVAVGVSYDSDPEQVRQILLDCAAAHPDVLGRPEPRVFFQDFGDSALHFDIRFYIREIDNLLRVASEIRFAIKKAFVEAGVVIPFPQRDVRLISGGAVNDIDQR